MSFISRIVTSVRELPFGGALGALLDHAADQSPTGHGHETDLTDADRRHRVAFTIAAIALGGKMASADGDICRDEVAAFSEVFRISSDEEDHVRLVSDFARRSTHGFESCARQVGRMFATNPIVLEHLPDGLSILRWPTAGYPPLRRLSAGGRAPFGFEAPRLRPHPFDPNKAGCQDVYAILGVAADIPLSEIRIAYRRLVRESRPHLVLTQGLPPECMAFATVETARINAAHERLASGRSYKTEIG